MSGPLDTDAYVAQEAIAAEARGCRRADRVREMIEASEAILLGLDDEETITLDWDRARFRDLPGMRR